MKFKAYAWVSDDVLARKHLNNCLIIFCIARCTQYMDNKERVSRARELEIDGLSWECIGRSMGKKQQVLC